MANAMGLIFPLFNVVSAQEVLFGIPLYMQYIPHGLISAILFVRFISADSKKCQFGNCNDGFLSITDIFILATLITQLPSNTSQFVLGYTAGDEVQ